MVDLPPPTSEPEDIKPARRITNWVFKIACLIILAFLILCGLGAFMSDGFTAETSVEIAAPPADVFPFLEDLTYFQDWSPWHSDASADVVFGGSEYGVGQIAAWSCRAKPCLAGTQEIVVVQQGEFVQTQLNLNGETALATYALMTSDDRQTTTILMQVEHTVGGFPFIQRVFAGLRKQAIEKRYNRALTSLKSQVEVALEN